MNNHGHILDSVGWRFWLVVFVVLCGPATFVTWKLTVETAPLVTRIGTGIFAASLAAGFVTWAVNALLQARAARLAKLVKNRQRKQRKGKRKRRT